MAEEGHSSSRVEIDNTSSEEEIDANKSNISDQSRFETTSLKDQVICYLFCCIKWRRS